MVRIRLKAQPNCLYFKMQGDTLKYDACKKSQEIKYHYQFSKEFQMILDEAIEIDPKFDFPYRQKSVAYLKSGDFVTWRSLIDKAVELNPTEHLGPRAWCRFNWFDDFRGAIEDIELLDSLMENDIGGTTNGIYHLHVVRALAYKSLGDYNKAESIFIDLMKSKDYYLGNYDYYHLGVLKYLKGEYIEAISFFSKQKEYNNLAENMYYMALCHSKLKEPKERIKTYLQDALNMYASGNHIEEDYNDNKDKIYKADILNMIKSLD